MIQYKRWLRSWALLLVVAMLPLASPVRAASLQEEFDAICVHTRGAENLPLKKLQQLVSQCDTLREAIEKSNDPKKKVLLFRLKKCRNFLAFIIEAKQNSSAGSSK